MAKKAPGSRAAGILTERQIQILELRSKNHTQEETARRLDISRQDVSILEKRALRNIDRAFATIRMAENIGLLKRIRIDPGPHILVVAKRIIEFADEEGVRIRTSAIGLMTLIQTTAKVENGEVQSEIEAIILPDGRVIVKSLD